MTLKKRLDVVSYLCLVFVFSCVVVWQGGTMQYSTIQYECFERVCCCCLLGCFVLYVAVGRLAVWFCLAFVA